MNDSVALAISGAGFMPHGASYLWQPGVLSLHVISDLLIAIACGSIFLTLLNLVRQRRSVEFHWMFFCCATFIVASGTMHVMEIWVVWSPTHWLSGAVKAITALAAVLTAILLVRLVPSALRLPNPSILQRTNAELASQMAERARQLEVANRDLLQEAGERRRVEQGLRESERRVRAVVDSALSAVVVMGAEGQIIDWNSRAETMFGWSRAEVLGHTLSETIIPLRYREAHARGLDHFLATGEGPVFNRLMAMSALRRDGEEFPVELSISPLHSGDVVTFCGFITDITERQRAEQAVRKSERLLQAIIDNSATVVYVKDLQGRYLLVNRRYEELFHHSREWIVGKTDYDVFAKDVADAFRAVDERVLAADGAVQMEEVAPLDDGLHTYISNKCPLFDSEGKVYALCGISTDITERQRGERKQRQQLRQLELLNRITHAIGERQNLPSILQVVINSLEDHLPIDFGCTFSYDSVAQTVTVTSVGNRSQALASEWMLAPNTHLPVGGNGLSRCAQGHLVYEPDMAGAPFPWARNLTHAGLRSLVVAPLIAEGNVFGMLVAARTPANGFASSDCEFLRQLSDHVGLAAHQAKLYSDLQQTYDDLQRSQQTVLQQERLRALGEIASGVAHDINNAISPIGLYTESLLEREPGLSDRARSYLATIQRAIEDVAQTVGRMREFYRPREPQYNLAPVDLNRIVEQVIELTRVRWSNEPQESGIVIDVVTDLATDLPAIMAADSEIRDALTNLVFNAVDAMPNGGRLTLSTRVTDAAGISGNDLAKEVSLAVSDSGVGMDEATRLHCLEPFFTTKGERGTGLGLAMVYGMAQRHSADLSIESAPGEGTTVRLAFFAARTAATLASAPAAPKQRPRPLRILIVDDDPLVIESLGHILKHDGHQVTTADGGQAGIDAFVAAPKHGGEFDAVITDLGMPHIDGRRVAMAIKTVSPATPVILLTGWGQRLLADNDIPAHVDRVLDKPPKLEQLRDTLTELIAQPSRSAS
jgi:PAS domain S-box-containing protein